jgi:prepilin-type N-terminal cleavage/methylation domain-containing protein
MQKLRAHFHTRYGFTLLEIVFVIALLSIIAAVAYPKFSAVTKISLSTAMDKLKSDVYYAQELAVTTHTNCGIYIMNAGSYRIYKDGDTAIPALDPATFSDYEVSLASTITIATTAAGSKIEFDNSGVPYDGNGILTAEQIITLNGSEILKITPQTGWVHL